MTMDRAESQPRAKPWRVKYDGPCVRCGATLVKGTIAVCDRSSKTIHHVECPTVLEEAPAPIAEPEAPPIDFGVAGASAQREYERRLAKDKERREAKWGRLARLVGAWTGERQSTTAWSSGAEGEIKVANALADLSGVSVLHDRRVPRTRGNLDLLVISPAGVFVVDAKNHGGTVRIRNKGSFFRSDNRLYIGSRDRSKLAEDMGWQVEAVRSALATAGSDPLPSITPVLCFAGADWPWLSPPDSYNGVLLEGLNSLKRLVVQKPTLDEAAIDRYTRLLASAFPPK